MSNGVSGTNHGAPFRRRTIWWLAGIATTSFVAAIVVSIFGQEIVPTTTAGAHGYSRSAIGHHGLVALLRALDVRLTEAACDELLADLWAQQMCVAGSVQCGKLNAGAPPGAPPKLGSSSSSGNSNWASSGMGLAAVQQLAYAETTRVLDSRDLQPPVPPPRRSGH